MVVEITDRIKGLMKSLITRKGVNIQVLGREPPLPTDNTIMLYIVDEKHGIKEFRITHSLNMLLSKKSFGIAFGTTREADKSKVGVVMAWGYESPESFAKTLMEMKKAGIELKVVEE